MSEQSFLSRKVFLLGADFLEANSMLTRVQNVKFVPLLRGFVNTCIKYKRGKEQIDYSLFFNFYLYNIL